MPYTYYADFLLSYKVSVVLSCLEKNSHTIEAKMRIEHAHSQSRVLRLPPMALTEIDSPLPICHNNIIITMAASMRRLA